MVGYEASFTGTGIEHVYSVIAISEYGQRAWCRLESFIFSIINRIRDSEGTLRNLFSYSVWGDPEYKPGHPVRGRLQRQVATFTEDSRPSEGQLTDSGAGKRGSPFCCMVEAVNLKRMMVYDDLVSYMVGQGGDWDFVKSLDLGENSSLTAKGVTTLANFLATNASVHTVDLGMNEQLGEESAEAMFSSLKTNRSITKLNLFKTGAGDGAAKVLGEALAVNNSLTSLNLAYNHIKDEGLAQIAEGLGKNTGLQYLHLRSNDQTKEGSMAFLQALRLGGNHTLKKLVLNGC